MKPFFFTLPIARFDVRLLPPQARALGSPEFKQAVIEHFTKEYASQGQSALVFVDDENIEVATFPENLDPFDAVLQMLQGGRLKEAIPLLEALNRASPNDVRVLYNLGIAYSELKQFDEAIIRLKRAVALEPTHSHAWTGIGVAYQRLGKTKEATEALHRAIAADPGDGYAHRNLGAVLMTQNRFDEALTHLREAHHQLPDDPQAIFALAQCLQNIGGDSPATEADSLYKKLVDHYPASPMAEVARQARTQFAHKNLRAAAPGGFRPDVMMYIAGALDTFAKLGPKKRQEIAMEIALLGQGGLDINDSTQKYTLKSLPGQFSGLHLVSIMYAAFKQIDPTLDSGIDFSKEYDVVLSMKNR